MSLSRKLLYYGENHATTKILKYSLISFDRKICSTRFSLWQQTTLLDLCESPTRIHKLLVEEKHVLSLIVYPLERSSLFSNSSMLGLIHNTIGHKLVCQALTKHCGWCFQTSPYLPDTPSVNIGHKIVLHQYFIDATYLWFSLLICKRRKPSGNIWTKLGHLYGTQKNKIGSDTALNALKCNINRFLGIAER